MISLKIIKSMNLEDDLDFFPPTTNIFGMSIIYLTSTTAINLPRFIEFTYKRFQYREKDAPV